MNTQTNTETTSHRINNTGFSVSLNNDNDAAYRITVNQWILDQKLDIINEKINRILQFFDLPKKV